MRKDKEKVIDEVWTEDHVRSFLNARPHDGTDENFHMLHKAYQSMRASDFELFVSFFREQNRDVNATGRDGRTVLDIVSTHRHGPEYADILRKAGASS
jgi:ankyrin repeat protein